MERVTDKGYWMDSILKDNLNSLAYNLKKDFDSIILISGSGLVRVGKSMMAQQVGYYLAYRLTTSFSIENIVFNSADLMATAHRLPKNSIIIYDEARESLDSKKVMESITKNLMDFFAECGMYNHCIIVVLPDFFELPKNIAINRSECLINVTRTSELKKDADGNEVVSFERGIFEFFNRGQKQRLYIDGKKKYNNYGLSKNIRSFWGEFREFWVLDREEYEAKKLVHLKRERSSVEVGISTRKAKWDHAKLVVALKILSSHYSLNKLAETFALYGSSTDRKVLSAYIDEYRHSEGDVGSYGDEGEVSLIETPGEGVSDVFG